MKSTITLWFENCEFVEFEVNHQTHFCIEDLRTSCNLNTSEYIVEESKYFTKAYMLIPSNVKIIGQEGTISHFLSKNNKASVDRVLQYNDITSVHVGNQVFYPSFIGCQNNKYQKSYRTEEGNILIDWYDCFKASEDIYIASEDEQDMLNVIDAHCNY